MRSAWVVCVLCGCWAVSASHSNGSISLEAGTRYVLKSQWSADDVIDTVEWWRQGSGPVVDWSTADNKTVFSGHLQGRAWLDVLTGDVLIADLRASDSGVYTAIINSIQTQRMDVVVIAAVPVPVVSWACQPEGEGIFCVLTCEGDTSGAEPVDYSWASCRDWDCHQQPNISNEGDAHAHAQTINVTMEAGSDAEEFICSIKNTISLQRSKPSTRPSTLRETLHPMKGVIVFVSFIVVVMAAITLHRCLTGVWFFHKESMPWESDFWKRSRKAGDDPENNQPKEQDELKANPEEETEH